MIPDSPRDLLQWVILGAILVWTGVSFFLIHRPLVSYLWNHWWMTRQRNHLTRRMKRAYVSLLRKEYHAGICKRKK